MSLIKRGMKNLLTILLLSVLGMTKAMAQTPYRQYADKGILLNFQEIDNVDFRIFLLYNLSQEDQFVLIENEESGQFSIIANDEMEATSFYDVFETFYQNAYTDFSLFSKTDIADLLSVWKSEVAPQHFTSTMMDITLRNSRDGENAHCINSVPFCTSDFYEFDAAVTLQTADDLEPVTIDDGCIGASFSPSWYYLRIDQSGQFTIHIEGHDPNDPSSSRDIDFCIWGPYTEEQVSSGYACTHLTSDKIIDCSFSAGYSENAYLGYPDNEHNHGGAGHGTVNDHGPQTGEHYLLMVTNYLRQPCVITFTKPDETEPGTTDCSILPPIIDNDGPYCVGETIHLTAIGVRGAQYSWTGPNNYTSRFQNPSRTNCTMAMAGTYTCTITKNNQTVSSTTEVIIYDDIFYTEISVAVCDTNTNTYTWHGNTYTESGDYVDTIETSQGCRRIETLHLTINEAEIEEFTASAYNSYTWHDQTYTESGTYIFETQTLEGCTHIEMLHLTLGKHWMPIDEGAYALSMTIYGVIQIDGVEQYSDQLEVGVFCGDECRGTASANEFFLTHRYLAEVNVYGENGHQLTFKLYDHRTNQELAPTSTEAIAFTLDGYGNPIEPYVLNFTPIVPSTTYHFITAGNWSQASNWSGGTLPGANDVVSIDANCTLNRNATVASLTVSTGKTLTLSSGKTLTVTNTLTNTATTGLVIEDGAQLRHASDNVSATVKKSIVGHGTSAGKYYLISNPLTSVVNPEMSSVYHLITGNYDLYSWLPSAPDNLEWRNIKDNSFLMSPEACGYLYANQAGIELDFTGTVKPSHNRYAKSVSYDSNDTEHPGWNLIGNPFVCNAQLVNANNEPLPYYRMNAAGNGFEAVAPGTPIAPMEGVFYKASSNGVVYFIRAD